ncbi:MAG: apolipoprotein N-acyltransferase [Candidatus Adiutrix sp.]|jgi:apolipoprotein N-acyltransferase|nr:apolipoprotein N-acyltransferase [Candidatus Adiutrix sp.]
MAETGFRKKKGLTFRDLKPSLGLPLVLAVLGGLLQTLSWPWPGLWPLCLVALLPLIVAVDGQSGRRAFFLGWVYGLSLSFSSLPWLADVLAGYGGLGPVPGWAVLGLLAAFLALYQAFFAWVITISLPGPFFWAILGSAAWCGLDWLKNWVFTGFNWTPLAGPLALSAEMGQSAEIFGFYGLGFFVALVNFFLAIVIFKRREGKTARARRYLGLAVALVLINFVYGHYQFQRWEGLAGQAVKRTAAVVQPCTDQVVKWDAGYRDSLLNRYELLAREAADLKPWLTLWPETAMPFTFDYDQPESEWLERTSRQSGGWILTGVAGAGGHWPEMKLFNRMLLFSGGQVAGWYDKRHLVPFGEYLPLDWLPFLKWAFMQGLIGAAGNYSPGEARPLMLVPLDPDRPSAGQVRLGFLICFESTFPYIGRQRILEGAELLLVPTNDGWFGRSRAPEQHLIQSAMRAIETRRPVLRAGNTGISAVIHPSGLIAWESELYEVGVYPLETPILNQADLKTTSFVRWGHWLPPFMAALTGFLAVIRFCRKQK